MAISDVHIHCLDIHIPILMTGQPQKCFVYLYIVVALEQELSCKPVLEGVLNFWKPRKRLIIIRQTYMYMYIQAYTCTCTYMYIHIYIHALQHCSSGDASSFPSPSLSPPPPLRNEFTP